LAAGELAADALAAGPWFAAALLADALPDAAAYSSTAAAPTRHVVTASANVAVTTDNRRGQQDFPHA